MAKLVIKVSIAAIIIYFLVKTDKLDFALVAQAWNHPGRWMCATLLIILQVLLTAKRLQCIIQHYYFLKKCETKLQFWASVKMTWIGLLFNAFLLGGVSGDAVKLLYLRNAGTTNTKDGLVILFFDRLLGLVGLMFLLGIFSLFSMKSLIEHVPHSWLLISVNLSLLVVGAAFPFVLNYVPERFFPKKILSIKRFIQHPQVMIPSIAISFLGHFLLVLAFWILTAPFYSAPLPLMHLFAFVPLGFLSVAVPITPMGIGVGHTVFDIFFKSFGITGGASLFNLYFVAQLLINMMGLIPYLAAKKNQRVSGLPA